MSCGSDAGIILFWNFICAEIVLLSDIYRGLCHSNPHVGIDTVDILLLIESHLP